MLKSEWQFFLKLRKKKHFEVLIEHLAPHTYGQMDNYGVVKDEGKISY